MSKAEKVAQLQEYIDFQLNQHAGKFTVTLEPGIAIIEYQIDDRVHTNAMVFYTEPDWRKRLDAKTLVGLSNKIIVDAAHKFATQKSASHYTDAARAHAAQALEAMTAAVR